MRQREVDDLQRRITAALAAFARGEQRIAAIDEASATERGIAAGDWTLGPAHYFRRLADERATLAAAQDQAEATLAALRDAAANAFASLSAIKEAAARWRCDELRRIDSREQAASDDRSATIHAAAGRARRAA
jgi:hypothetical protein